MSTFCLPESLKPAVLLSNRVGAGDVTSAYASLKNALRAWLVVNFTEGQADTVAFIPMRATAVAPSDAAVLVNAVRIWSDLATATSDRLVERTAAVNYTTENGVASKLIIFEINPDDLGETAGGVPYDCIGIRCNAPNALDYVCVTLWIEPRYPSRVLTAPTVVTD